ncbi:hypothetical protein OK016_05820 [Vibrio chagasii]|nr:hypothetical protein [Vibrio chagasii]
MKATGITKLEQVKILANLPLSSARVVLGELKKGCVFAFVQRNAVNAATRLHRTGNSPFRPLPRWWQLNLRGAANAG